MLRHLYSREPSVNRATAREALAKRGGAEVTAALGEYLTVDESPRARALLALLLGRRGDRSAGTVLLGALSDPSPMVRSAAAESLTRLHGECLGFERTAWAGAVARAAP